MWMHAPTIRLSMGTAMENLGKEVKKLKGFTSPKEEQHYQPPRPPELPGTKPPTKEYTWRGPWLQLLM